MHLKHEIDNKDLSVIRRIVAHSNFTLNLIVSHPQTLIGLNAIFYANLRQLLFGKKIDK